MKFLISNTGVGIIHVDQKEAWQCYHDSLKVRSPKIGKNNKGNKTPEKSNQAVGMSNRAPYPSVHVTKLEKLDRLVDDHCQSATELHLERLDSRPEQIDYGKNIAPDQTSIAEPIA